MRILIISIMSLSLSACAFGHSFRYNNITANVPKTEATTIAVATLDKRPYIVDQDSDPSYAGMTRGGYGNPFSAYTQSGKPLADEMTGILVRSLEENGVKATSITTNFQENATQVTAKLVATGAERALLLTLLNWQSDTMNNTSLEYDITLEVLDANGASLGRKTLKGNDDLGGSFMNPVGHASTALPPAVKKIIRNLFDSPEIRKALQ